MRAKEMLTAMNYGEANIQSVNSMYENDEDTVSIRHQRTIKTCQLGMGTKRFRDTSGIQRHAEQSILCTNHEHQFQKHERGSEHH